MQTLYPKAPIGLCMVTLLNIEIQMLANRMRLYPPPKCPQTLCLDSRSLGIMRSGYRSIQESVAPRLGSVSKAAAAAATDSSLWLSRGCTGEGLTSATLSVSCGRRPQPKALIPVRGDRPVPSESHHAERFQQLDKVDFCLLKLIIKTRLAFYVSVYLYFIFLIIHFYGIS